jgi:hypothetical protein
MNIFFSIFYSRENQPLVSFFCSTENDIANVETYWRNYDFKTIPSTYVVWGQVAEENIWT